MNTNHRTGTSLAFDLMNRLIELDALLGHCDLDDKVELAERLDDLEVSEFQHILDLLIERGIVLGSAVTTTTTEEEAREGVA